MLRGTMTVPAGAGSGLATAVLRSATDERLVEYVREGSTEAFETLFDRYHRSVLEFCAHMLGSLDEADDAAQLAFLAAYHDLVRNAHPVSVRAWLYGIARHRCLTALRARRHHPIRDIDDPTQRYELSAEVGARDEVRGLLADVARLPDDQRAALVLAEIGGLSHAEIARVVGCPRRKVKALVFQARASLRVARAARDTPCAEIREQLTTLRGPALTRATLRRHLEDCPGCRAYRDAIRDRRRRRVPGLAWVPFVGIKRSVLGSVAGSGGGAGGFALTGGALGGAGLAVAVTIAATAAPPVAPVGRDVSVPVPPIAHAAAFPAQHAGSSASVGDIGRRDTIGTPLEDGDGAADGSDDVAGGDDDAGAPGTGEPSASLETSVESDSGPPDEPAGDAGADAPELDPAQPVLDEWAESVPPAILKPPATTRPSSGGTAAPTTPPPGVAQRPRPITPTRPDTPRPTSSSPRAGNPRPNPTIPPRPDDHRADGARSPAPERADTRPSRPDGRDGGSGPRPRSDTSDAAPAAPEPPPSGRDGAREAKDGSVAAREASPEKPRTGPR